MTDWGSLLGHALWITGLALGLAALSVAQHQAAGQRRSLRETVLAPGFQAAAQVAAVLVCAGISFAVSVWWVRGTAAMAATGLAGWTLASRLHRQRRFASASSSRTYEVQGAAIPLSRRGALGWSLVAAGVLVIGGWSIITGVETVARARSLVAQVDQLQSLAQVGPEGLQSSDLELAGQHLATMHEDLQVIDARVGPLLPLGRLLEWLPTYGGDLAAAADLLDLGLNLTTAGERVFQGLSPALGLLEGARGDSASALQPGEQLLPILVSARPEFEIAQQELANVEQIRGQLDPVRLSPKAATWLDNLDRYQPWFETAVDGALLAPSLLGAGGQRTYLVVAQNNHELRATGGFVSGVGEIHVEGGKIVSFEFRDSYAVDNFGVPHDAAPPDLQATLFGQMWLFRDGNWEPDFVASARKMLEIYARDQGVSADGLIAVDLTALELLVGALGPLDVEGISQPVTRENVQQLLQERWAEPSAGPALEDSWDRAWWVHRKDFMGEVAAALLDRVQTGREIPLGALAGALNQALQEKHILLDLADAEASGLLRRRKWDGALSSGTSLADYLMIVDSNVGFNKVDPNIVRSVRYEVDLSRTEEPRARLTLTYQNRSSRPVDICFQEARYGESYAEMMDRCYWDYVRVYVPPGSHLLAGPDLTAPAGSLLARSGVSTMPPATAEGFGSDLAVWSAFFDLAPGQERALVFDYALPASVLEQQAEGLASYRLLVQKQPGTAAVPFQLELVLPADAGVVQTLPAGLVFQEAGDPGQQANLVLSTDLRVDRQLKVTFRCGGNHE
jgi:hypothetical protein